MWENTITNTILNYPLSKNSHISTAFTNSYTVGKNYKFWGMKKYCCTHWDLNPGPLSYFRWTLISPQFFSQIFGFGGIRVQYVVNESFQVRIPPGSTGFFFHVQKIANFAYCELYVLNSILHVLNYYFRSVDFPGGLTEMKHFVTPLKWKRRYLGLSENWSSNVNL